MNRKVIRIVSILLMVLMVVTMLSMPVLATADVDTTDYSDLTQFDNKSKDKQTAGVFQGFIATAINLVQVVGMAVAIIMLIVMAIKYISAAPSEKAEIKKSATIYIVGAIVLFAATGILQVVKNFASANIQAEAPSASVVVEMVDMNNTYLG